jgi:hypothetical protein
LLKVRYHRVTSAVHGVPEPVTVHYGTVTESRQGLFSSVLARLRARNLLPVGGVVGNMLVAWEKR